MKNHALIDGIAYDLSNPVDISIPLRFGGPQPNAFGVGPADSEALGDTRSGSSVNFERYTFAAHCSGTHTECVGHVTHERISIRSCLADCLVSAVLITIAPEVSSSDRVITAPQVRQAMEAVVHDVWRSASARPKALAVRTVPNDEPKLTRRYDAENIPPYFSEEAVQLVLDMGVDHLLVDLPSIDRLLDEGKLANHRIFWQVQPGSFETGPNTRKGATITELIFVPNDIADGRYLLNLQIAPFESDAAPSRPVLFRPI
jgi:kynurenine formamidase